MKNTIQEISKTDHLLNSILTVQIAERLNYINDIKQGEWIQYYPDGAVCLKSNYLNGKINGKFEVWFENGRY